MKVEKNAREGRGERERERKQDSGERAKCTHIKGKQAETQEKKKRVN